jgi:hypothetical protein
MPKFMMLYVGLAARPEADDEQTRDYNTQWLGYMAGLARDGALESGAPLEPDGRVVQRDSVAQFELSTPDIGGYAVIDAGSLEAAVEIARDAPHIALGGTTIVRPCIPVVP